MEKEKKESVYKFFDKLGRLTAKALVDNNIKQKENGVGFELETEMSEDQKHITGLFKRYSKIVKTTEQLDTILRLLAVKPTLYFMKEAEIEYSKYLGYNLENYFIRITSILDQSIILVCEFYNLGIEPKNTNLRTLTENRHTKGKDATEILKKFDRLILPIKNIRNLIAHRGEFNDEDLMKIEANLYMLSMIDEKNLDDPIFHRMLDLVDELINKKIEFVKHTNEGVSKFLFALDHVLNKDFSG